MVKVLIIGLKIDGCSSDSEPPPPPPPHDTRINNEYSITIPNESNACKKNRDLLIPAFRNCGVISVGHNWNGEVAIKTEKDIKLSRSKRKIYFKIFILTVKRLLT